ncbi:MAG: hypothetical protein ACYS8W_08895 [Planctomycetota bacterium]|jgi:hypothetical protein
MRIKGRIRILFIAAAIFLGATVPLSLFLLFYRSEPEQRFIISITPEQVPFLKQHPELGFICPPGKYKFVVRKRDIDGTLEFEVTNNDEGYRITSGNPSENHGKPRILIYGCSFTYGLGLNDAETFPWKLQRELTEYDVRNYGMNAFGSIHALIQAKSHIDSGVTLAVFSYASFHNARNVLTPTWQKSFAYNLKDSEGTQRAQDYLLPKAVLRTGGDLAVEYVRIDPYCTDDDPEPDLMHKVTKKIFEGIYRICEDKSVIPVALVFTEPDAVTEHMQKLGFNVLFLEINWRDPEYGLRLFAFHPNDKLTDILASMLYEYITALLK